MDRAEFDQFAFEYERLHARNIAITGEAPDYFAEYKAKDVADAAHRRLPAGGTPALLDFGSGVGTSVPWFRKHLPEAALTCLDVSEKSLAIARQRYPAAARFIHFDGGRLPFPDGSFDLAFAACVFHHIDHSEHARLFDELRRVLKPAGQLFVFEHNPLNPLTVRAVNTCEFDRNAHLIPAPAMRRRLRKAGFGLVRIRYRIFFPRLLSGLRGLEPWLTGVPLGAQYYAMADVSPSGR